MPHELPNILITGTPGTGKTTCAAMLAQQTGLRHLDVGALVREHGLHTGRDEEFDSLLVDDDLLCDFLEDQLLIDKPLSAAAGRGGYIVDFHTPEIFPERYFDLVIVLRATTENIYDRLSARGYISHKVQENVTAEIMQVVLEAAAESYNNNIIIELESNTETDMQRNISYLAEKCLQLVNQKKD